MSKEQEPDISHEGAAQEVARASFFKILNQLEDVKNNAARQSGLDDKIFWKEVEKDMQKWRLDTIYMFIVFEKLFPDELIKKWGEKSGSLLSMAIKTYHERGGTEPIAAPQKKRKSKWG